MASVRNPLAQLSPFTKLLPAEVRNRIYDFYFTLPEKRLYYDQDKGRFSTQIGKYKAPDFNLIFTCKEICVETFFLPLRCNQLCFEEEDASQDPKHYRSGALRETYGPAKKTVFQYWQDLCARLRHLETEYQQTIVIENVQFILTMYHEGRDRICASNWHWVDRYLKRMVNVHMPWQVIPKALDFDGKFAAKVEIVARYGPEDLYRYEREGEAFRNTPCQWLHLRRWIDARPRRLSAGANDAAEDLMPHLTVTIDPVFGYIVDEVERMREEGWGKQLKEAMFERL